MLSVLIHSLHTFRCVLSGVQDLHNANYGHTDIRWQNIIQCGNSYRLIDLEFVCKLNQPPFTPPGQHILPTPWLLSAVPWQSIIASATFLAILDPPYLYESEHAISALVQGMSGKLGLICTFTSHCG